MLQSLNGFAAFDPSKIPRITPPSNTPGCWRAAVTPRADPSTVSPVPESAWFTFAGLKLVQNWLLMHAPPPSRYQSKPVPVPVLTKKPAGDPSRHVVLGISYQTH